MQGRNLSSSFRIREFSPRLSRQDYIVKLIEDAEAAQLRYQSPKQFRPDRNEQRYHKPDYQSHHCAGSYSAPKYLLFAGRHFNLPKASETLPHPRSTVTVQTIRWSPTKLRPELERLDQWAAG